MLDQDRLTFAHWLSAMILLRVALILADQVDRPGDR